MFANVSWSSAKRQCPCRQGTAGGSGDGPGDSVTEGVCNRWLEGCVRRSTQRLEDYPLVTESGPETANVMNYLPENQMEQAKTAIGQSGGWVPRTVWPEEKSWPRGFERELEEINLDVPPCIAACPIYRCHRVPIPGFA